MLENLSLTEIKSDLLAWFQGEIWTIDFGVQFVMVALAFVLGYLAKNILKPRHVSYTHLTLPTIYSV